MKFTPHPDYDLLPEAIRHTMTPEEFACMPDEERSRIVEDHCYPDKELFDA